MSNNKEIFEKIDSGDFQKFGYLSTTASTVEFSGLTVNNNIDIKGNLDVGGNISGSTFYGDASGLTNVGGSSRTKSSLQTTGSTTQTLDTIDNLSDDTTNLIDVYVKNYGSSGSEYGIWKRTLTVTKTSGTASLKRENVDVDEQSNNLNANSVSFNATGGNVEINVTGIDSTTLDWESAYEIII